MQRARRAASNLVQRDGREAAAGKRVVDHIDTERQHLPADARCAGAGNVFPKLAKQGFVAHVCLPIVRDLFLLGSRVKLSDYFQDRPDPNCGSGKLTDLAVA